ncbi:MAG: hypothetical protein ACLFS6_08880, partial [Methanomassiliicoccales archaeon]
EVRNPFSKVLEQKTHKRNIRPKLRNLIYSIAYANRHRRPIERDGEKKIILCSLSDVLWGLKLWRANEKYINRAFPEYYHRFLKIFSPREWLNREEMVEAYRELYEQSISSGTAYQYAKYLVDKNVLTSRIREGERFNEYALMESREGLMPRSLELIEFSRDDLANRLEVIYSSGLGRFRNTQDIGALADQLLDAEIPKGEGEESRDGEWEDNRPLSESERNEEIIKRVEWLINRQPPRNVDLQKVGKEIEDLFQDRDSAIEYFREASEQNRIPFSVGVYGRIWR